MEIVEGKVSNYKGHGDIFRNYGKINDEIKYYFLDYSAFSNGNLIATTDLVEAIDSEVSATHIGLVDKDGNVVIPLENKTVKPLTNDIILVEKATPTSQNVLDSIELSKNNNGAASLVALTNTCKNKVMSKLGASSGLVFHNQLSEASIFDINGKNLVNDEYYSYIGLNDEKIFLGKNTEDSTVVEYTLSDLVSGNVEGNIDVKETSTSSEEIKEQVDSEMNSDKAEVVDEDKYVANTTEEAKEETAPAPVEEPTPVAPENNEEVKEDVVVPTVPVAEETPVEENSALPEIPETPTEESTPVEETPVEENPEVTKLDDTTEETEDVQLPEIPETPEETSETPEETPVEETTEVAEETPVEENVEVSTEEVSEENQDLKDIFGEETEEEVKEEENNFSDLNVDTIDSESYNIDDGKYDYYEPVSTSYNDDVLSNAGRVMESLISQNRRQRSEINKLNLDLDKANNNIRLKQEQVETVENRLEIATNKLRNLDIVVNKLENNNSMLKSKLDDLKRQFDSQARDIANKDRELEELRREVQGKEDLARYVQDAKNLLSENEY